MNPSLSSESKLDQAGRLFGGSLIPRFVEGPGGPQITSAADMNRIVDALNAFLRMRITRGSTDAVIISDAEVIIQLRDGPDPLSMLTAG